MPSHRPPSLAPDTKDLLRAAITLRLREASESADMLTAALKTLSDELIAQECEAEEMIVVLHGVWRDVLMKSAYTPYVIGDRLYVEMIRQAFVIFNASRE